MLQTTSAMQLKIVKEYGSPQQLFQMTISVDLYASILRNRQGYLGVRIDKGKSTSVFLLT